MNFIKKQGIASYITVVALILAIVCTALYGADAGLAYYASAANGAVMAMSVLAIIFFAASLAVSQFAISENKIVKIVLDIIRVLATVFMVASMMLFIGDRVYHFAIVLGSDLERGNDAAFAAVNHSITVIAMYAVTFVISLVAVFFGMVKKEN